MKEETEIKWIKERWTSVKINRLKAKRDDNGRRETVEERRGKSGEKIE